MHLGFDEKILNILGTVARAFKASPVHLGKVISDNSVKEFDKLSEQLKKLETDKKRLLDSLEYEDEDTRRYESIEKRIETTDEKILDLSESYVNLTEGFDENMSLVASFLPGLQFCAPKNEAEIINTTRKRKDLTSDNIIISNYLMLTGKNFISDSSVIRPVNRNTLFALKQYCNRYSWIAPHPVPAVIPVARPGLNNVHNYYSVGSLKQPIEPLKKQDISKASHSPAAMLVVVDQESGEFHATHLHVDFISKKGYKKESPVILYDGLCFNDKGEVLNLDSKDKGIFETDDHAPYTHAGVLGAVKGLCSLHKPSVFVNGGDASDCSPVCHHDDNFPGRKENKRIRDMLLELQKLLNFQGSEPSIKTKILLDSNHGQWLTDYVNTNPELKGLLDWESVQRDYLQDWIVPIRRHGENKPFKFGDYTLRHGDREPYARGELIFEEGKYLCGHWHRHQAVRRSVSVGCGGQLSPGYTGNQINDWQNQVTTMTKYHEVTAIAPKMIIHNEDKKKSRFCYRDKIYECDFIELF